MAKVKLEDRITIAQNSVALTEKRLKSYTEATDIQIESLQQQVKFLTRQLELLLVFLRIEFYQEEGFRSLRND